MARIRRSLNYTKALVIVHGKSELYFFEHIRSSLRLPIKSHSNHKGNSSIQINGLIEILSKKPFSNTQQLAEKYSIEYNSKTHKLKNFRLFIIMDTDDCSDDTRKKYIESTMFANLPLSQYITPIYNISNLEDVLIRTSIMPERIRDEEKGDYYLKIFPTIRNRKHEEAINGIKLLRDELANAGNTNLHTFIDYCFQTASTISPR